jgi:hypothetical protein
MRMPSAMPSCGKRSVLTQMPRALPGTATVLALSRTCLKADGAHVGFRCSRPHRHADRRARQVEIRSRNDTPSNEQFVEASLDRITTSAGTLRASCAAIACGPVPYDAPDPVVTLMPLACSKPGNSCW